MPGKRKFEEQLAVLDALRHQPPELSIEPLRKALANRNNFIVGKAADLVCELKLIQLTPVLLSAFDRFFDEPVKTDPQCWAKNAISRALAGFEHQDAEVFLRGLKHIQHEPGYGGSSDSAATLRATCAHALVQCRSLRDTDLLPHLIDLLADPDKTVRVEAVRAIESVGTASALILRTRAIVGSDEPEVLGACYSGILRLEGVSAISWVSRFLSAGDDAAAEAALAIAETHSLEGFNCLRERFAKGTDAWFCSVLLSAIALTRQGAAFGFLLDQVRKESLHAERAIEAILRSGPPEAVVKKLEELVKSNPRLRRAFQENRSPR